jgi:hypothetical protein
MNLRRLTEKPPRPPARQFAFEPVKSGTHQDERFLFIYFDQSPVKFGVGEAGKL